MNHRKIAAAHPFKETELGLPKNKGKMHSMYNECIVLAVKEYCDLHGITDIHAFSIQRNNGIENLCYNTKPIYKVELIIAYQNDDFVRNEITVAVQCTPIITPPATT